MDHRWRVRVACAGIVGIFLLVQLGALGMVEPFQEEGHQAVEDTEDPTLSLVFVVAILAVTGLMLAAFRLGGDAVMRLVIIFAGAYISFFVFDVFFANVASVTLDGLPVNLVAVLGSFLVAVVLYVYPEWYVIDTAGILMGVGAAGIFGINFGILPALVLLVVLAVYDAISVYGTEHMLALASGAMEMHVPVVLVMPVSLSYSFLDEGGPDTVDESSPDTADDSDIGRDRDPNDANELDAETLNSMTDTEIEALTDDQLDDIDPEIIDELDDETETALREQLPDREALFIGLGDAVIPTVLVASVAFFVEAGPELSLGVVSAPLPAVTAMAGTIVGLAVLLWLVLKGRAHAGLPLLNGGTIAGYLLGALLSGMTLVEALGIDGFV